MDSITTRQQLGDIFRLLAALFYEPEKELLEEEKVCQNLSLLLEHFCPPARLLVADMYRGLQHSSQEELLVAHAELFVGPFELKASPYGSTYLENRHQLMGDSTMKVLKHYQRAGLEVDIKQPPDHIAFELEFVSYLCGLQAEALLAGEPEKSSDLEVEQKFFLRVYVLPWMSDFIKNIRSGTENGFYLALADCLEQFFQDDMTEVVYADAAVH